MAVSYYYFPFWSSAQPGQASSCVGPYLVVEGLTCAGHSNPVCHSFLGQVLWADPVLNSRTLREAKHWWEQTRLCIELWSKYKIVAWWGKSLSFLLNQKKKKQIWELNHRMQVPEGSDYDFQDQHRALPSAWYAGSDLTVWYRRNERGQAHLAAQDLNSCFDFRLSVETLWTLSPDTLHPATSIQLAGLLPLNPSP